MQKTKLKTYIIVFFIVLFAMTVEFFFLAGAGYYFASTPGLQTYNASEYGFSFQYSPSEFFVSDDTADGWILVMPIAIKDNPNGDIEGIVISPRQNSPSETALDWLKSPDSGYDMSQGYKTEQVGGQEAISVEDGDWVVVNTPDNTESLSIALLPDSATSTTPTALTSLRNEMAVVLASLSFGN